MTDYSTSKELRAQGLRIIPTAPAHFDQKDCARRQNKRVKRLLAQRSKEDKTIQQVRQMLNRLQFHFVGNGIIRNFFERFE